MTALPAAEQPVQTDIRMADGVFIKSIRVAKSDTLLPQHAHSYPHISVIAIGAVEVFRHERSIGIYAAPASVLIPAQVKHMFKTLVDGTVILCVHDIGTADAVDIHEEHNAFEEIAPCPSV